MKENDYYYVKSIAETRNISKAAEKLYISQPALTKYINNLERELGVRLFDRSKHPIDLTYAGERFLTGMQNVIGMELHLRDEMKQIAEMKKEKLTVGIPATRSRRWLSAILPVLLRDCPDIDLRVTENTTEPLEQDLINERIDLALAISLPLMSPLLSYTVLSREQMMLLTGPKHPIFKNADISEALKNRRALHYIPPERFNNQPYISSDSTQGLYRYSSELFELHSVTPKKILTISNTAAARDLSLTGIGFSVLPTTDANAQRLSEHEVLCCTMSDPATYRSIIIAYKKDRPLSSSAKRFIDITGSIALTPELLPLELPIVHDIVFE